MTTPENNNIASVGLDANVSVNTGVFIGIAIALSVPIVIYFTGLYISKKSYFTK